MIDSVKIENGKYEIVLDDSYNVHIYRGGELRVVEPPFPKMLISVLYELIESRKLLSDISFDFDPDETLGPPCGPEMLEKIKEHADRFYFKLNEQ